MKIIVSSPEGDLLYKDFIDYLAEVKLVQGPKVVASTLFWHKAINDFLVSHQKQRLRELEDLYKKSCADDNSDIKSN